MVLRAAFCSQKGKKCFSCVSVENVFEGEKLIKLLNRKCEVRKGNKVYRLNPRPIKCNDILNIRLLL